MRAADWMGRVYKVTGKIEIYNKTLARNINADRADEFQIQVVAKTKSDSFDTAKKFLTDSYIGGIPELTISFSFLDSELIGFAVVKGGV